MDKFRVEYEFGDYDWETNDYLYEVIAESVQDAAAVGINMDGLEDASFRVFRYIEEDGIESLERHNPIYFDGFNVRNRNRLNLSDNVFSIYREDGYTIVQELYIKDVMGGGKYLASGGGFKHKITDADIGTAIYLTRDECFKHVHGQYVEFNYMGHTVVLNEDGGIYTI